MLLILTNVFWENWSDSIPWGQRLEIPKTAKICKNIINTVDSLLFVGY